MKHLTLPNNIEAIPQLNEFIDMIVPRGSNSFVKYIMEHTTIPVLGHSSGLCHLYIDRAANAEMACRIAVDAKTQAPSIEEFRKMIRTALENEAKGRRHGELVEKLNKVKAAAAAKAETAEK